MREGVDVGRFNREAVEHAVRTRVQDCAHETGRKWTSNVARCPHRLPRRQASNVLVDYDGQVKLLDFGIAKLLEDEGDSAARSGRRVRYGYNGHERSSMRSANIAELRDRLTQYLREVRAGEEIIVRDRQRPIARIVPATVDDDTEDAELITAGLMRKAQLPCPLPSGEPGVLRWASGRRPPRSARTAPIGDAVGFWDASAIVPLCCSQGATSRSRKLFRDAGRVDRLVGYSCRCAKRVRATCARRLPHGRGTRQGGEDAGPAAAVVG